jgi:hypothetical protein
MLAAVFILNLSHVLYLLVPKPRNYKEGSGEEDDEEDGYAYEQAVEYEGYEPNGYEEYNDYGEYDNYEDGEEYYDMEEYGDE